MGYAPLGDPQRLVREMARVVRPSGMVAILAWSSQQLLPGYPRLEAELNATSSGIAPFSSHMAPEWHWLRALSWFRSAELHDAKAQTILAEAQAPLAAPMREALADLIAMRWPGASRELEPADRERYERLCSPDSLEYVLDLPDYYAFWTETLVWGKLAA